MSRRCFHCDEDCNLTCLEYKSWKLEQEMELGTKIDQVKKFEKASGRAFTFPLSNRIDTGINLDTLLELLAALRPDLVNLPTKIALARPNFEGNTSDIGDGS
jgi:hypothetical protein